MKNQDDYLDVKEKTIILGLGNPLRSDDGIGIAVVEALRESCALPDAITIMDAGTSDLEALLFMQGYHRAFLIDAADLGGEPGDWRCIPIHNISSIPEVLTHYGSFHHAGLKDAIALGQALEILPKEIYIYAVQPQDLQLSIGLSQSNSTATQEIIEDLLNRLVRSREQLRNLNE
jgi:hydrogenase maturation protease